MCNYCYNIHYSISYSDFVSDQTQDEGEPPLSGSVDVLVRVDPVPPTFSQSIYEAELLEFTDKVG